jgi:glutathione S-transferase
MSKPTHTRFLPETQADAAKLERALQLAFLNSTSAVGKRPEGTAKSRFNNAARKSNAARPWEQFAESLRAVAADAAEIGGPTVEATEERIIDVTICFLEFVLEPMKRADAGAVTYLAAAKEVPEAIDWMARARLAPTPETLARTDQEVSEAERVLRLHRSSLRRSRDFPRSMGAPPLGA